MRNARITAPRSRTTTRPMPHAGIPPESSVVVVDEVAPTIEVGVIVDVVVVVVVVPVVAVVLSVIVSSSGFRFEACRVAQRRRFVTNCWPSNR